MDAERNDEQGLTRGGLFKLGAVAAFAAGAVPAGRALAAPGRARSRLTVPRGGPAYLRHETFVPHVGSTFRVARPELPPLRVRLLESKRRHGAGESFSLLFHDNRQARVQQGTYRIEHPSLGAFDLFLVPVGRGVRGQDIEAVINRTAT